MAGFHPHDDPYYPNHNNTEWLGEEPENDHPIPVDGHQAEGLADGFDSEPEMVNLSSMTRVPNPNPRPAFQGPMPPWVECLEIWSEEQDQPMSFDGDRSFYNINEGTPADRIFPILVRRVARDEIQGRTTLHSIAEVDANARIHTIRTNRLDHTREKSAKDYETLLQALAESRTDVIKLRVRQRVYERHMLDMERQLAELRDHKKNDRRQ